MQSSLFQGHQRAPHPSSAKWMKLYIRVFCLLPPNPTRLGFLCPGSKSLTLNAGGTGIMLLLRSQERGAAAGASITRGKPALNSSDAT